MTLEILDSAAQFHFGKVFSSYLTLFFIGKPLSFGNESWSPCAMQMEFFSNFFNRFQLQLNLGSFRVLLDTKNLTLQ